MIWSDTAHSPSHGSAFPKRAKTKVVHVKPVELTKSEKHFISPLYKIRNHQIRYKIPKLDVAVRTPVARSNFPQNQSLIILRESVFFVRRAQNVAIAKVISTTIAVISIV